MERNETATDPVCGMTIETGSATGSSTHEGETYYFCAQSCQLRFEAAPEKYTGTVLARAASCSCC